MTLKVFSAHVVSRCELTWPSHQTSWWESLRIDSCDGASPPRNGKVEDFLFYRQAGFRSREWIMQGTHAYKHWSPHEDRLSILNWYYECTGV